MAPWLHKDLMMIGGLRILVILIGLVIQLSEAAAHDSLLQARACEAGLNAKASDNAQLRAQLLSVEEYLNTQVIGQSEVIRKSLIAVISGGHVLFESVAGLAKTTLVSQLSRAMNSEFNRIQMTPEVMPSEILGTEVLDFKTNEMKEIRGPVFTNILLVDELNRGTEKAQVALLQPMAEGAVTISNRTQLLPDLFIVFATQNPDGDRGTFPVVEAVLDRFMFRLDMSYTTQEEEMQILELVQGRQRSQNISRQPDIKLSREDILKIKENVFHVDVPKSVREQIVKLVAATRNIGMYDEEFAQYVSQGAGPRASLALDLAVRASAWMNGRETANVADIQYLAADVLRHRIRLTPEAIALKKSPDEIIKKLIEIIISE